MSMPKIKKGSFLDRYMLGTPMPNVASPKGDTCSFTIYGNSKRMGEIMTPTYPGTYPKNMLCSYKFIGRMTRSTLSQEKLSSSNMNQNSGNSCVKQTRIFM